MKSIRRDSKEMERIEALLAKTFLPVKPRESFVNRLQVKLDREMGKRKKTKKVTRGILVAGGIVGGVALLVTVIRSFTGEEGFFQTLSKQVSRFRKRQQTASA